MLFLPIISLALITGALAEGKQSFRSGTSDVKVQPRIFENQVQQQLDKLSESLAKNDPAHVSKLQFSANGQIGRINFEATDVTLSGFSQFRTTNLQIAMSPLSINFDLVLDGVNLVIPSYNVDAQAIFIPFYGRGSLNLHTKALSFGGDTQLKIGNDGINGLTNTTLRFGLKQSNLTITGVLNNDCMSQIISKAITECFPEFINTHSKRLGAIGGKILEYIAHKIFSTTPEERSIRLMSGGDTIVVENITITYYYEL